MAKRYVRVRIEEVSTRYAFMALEDSTGSLESGQQLDVNEFDKDEDAEMVAYLPVLDDEDLVDPIGTISKKDMLVKKSERRYIVD